MNEDGNDYENRRPTISQKVLLENFKSHTGMSDNDLDRIIGDFDEEHPRHSGMSANQVKMMTIEAIVENLQQNLENVKKLEKLEFSTRNIVDLLENSDYEIDTTLAKLTSDDTRLQMNLIAEYVGRDGVAEALRGSSQDVSLVAKMTLDKILIGLGDIYSDHKPNIKELDQRTSDFANKVIEEEKKEREEYKKNHPEEYEQERLLAKDGEFDEGYWNAWLKGEERAESNEPDDKSGDSFSDRYLKNKGNDNKNNER